MYKRFVALFLAVLMAITAAPVTASAGPSESHGYSQGYIFNEETQFCWLIFYGHIEPETTTGPALGFVLMFNENGACAECEAFFHTLKADPCGCIQTNAIFGDSPQSRNGRMMPNHHAILQSGNLFAYVMNDPINWIDPSGLYGIRSTFSNISNHQFNSITQSMNASVNALSNTEANTNMILDIAGGGVGLVIGAYMSGNLLLSIGTGAIGVLASATINRVVPMPSDVLGPIRSEMSGLQYRHQNTDHTFQISILNGSHSSEILVNVIDSNNQVVETMFFESRYGVILSEIFSIVSEIAPNVPTTEVVDTGFSLRS